MRLFCGQFRGQLLLQRLLRFPPPGFLRFPLAFSLCLAPGLLFRFSFPLRLRLFLGLRLAFGLLLFFGCRLAFGLRLAFRFLFLLLLFYCCSLAFSLLFHPLLCLSLAPGLLFRLRPVFGLLFHLAFFFCDRLLLGFITLVLFSQLLILDHLQLTRVDQLRLDRHFLSGRPAGLGCPVQTEDQYRK